MGATMSTVAASLPLRPSFPRSASTPGPRRPSRPVASSTRAGPERAGLGRSRRGRRREFYWACSAPVKTEGALPKKRLVTTYGE